MNQFIRDLRSNALLDRVARIVALFEWLQYIVVALVIVLGVVLFAKIDQERTRSKQTATPISQIAPIPENRFA